MHKDNGGPAFPQTLDSWNGKDGHSPVPEGMTLRDYFAGQVLSGWVSSENLKVPSNEEGKVVCKNIAIICYMLADAMIAERNR